MLIREMRKARSKAHDSIICACYDIEVIIFELNSDPFQVPSLLFLREQANVGQMCLVIGAVGEAAFA